MLRERIELSTSPPGGACSTAELRIRDGEAGVAPKPSKRAGFACHGLLASATPLAPFGKFSGTPFEPAAFAVSSRGMNWRGQEIQAGAYPQPPMQRAEAGAQGAGARRRPSATSGSRRNCAPAPAAAQQQAGPAAGRGQLTEPGDLSCRPPPSVERAAICPQLMAAAIVGFP